MFIPLAFMMADKMKGNGSDYEIFYNGYLVGRAHGNGCYYKVYKFPATKHSFVTSEQLKNETMVGYVIGNGGSYDYYKVDTELAAYLSTVDEYKHIDKKYKVGYSTSQGGAKIELYNIHRVLVAKSVGHCNDMEFIINRN